MLGVVPSFAIPWLRGMGDYVSLDGLTCYLVACVLVLLLVHFWRPKRPIVMFEDGELQ